MRSRILLCVFLVLTTACSSSNSDDSSGIPTGPSATPPTQLTIVDLTVGNGATAAAGNSLAVSYTGWLWNANGFENKGQVFDAANALAPFVFVLGAGNVIAGWDQGLVGMRVGGARRLTIPPGLAYGDAGNGPIPPGATLIFEIGLLSVQ
ncbi:MAG: FKBP-type peptidyl-prolyl cis-trans isomerase [Vicinamibacterales bacterium]|jgi:FKBP-type peptidyl-prolyl cis-trans isomerase|nr:peptidylprolyl isomerase [Acidobacteriota bacterium]MDP6373542.1 FKBP-type peptidyl-prolyl cis-trans isomerase [Vicinamibacterales bacterium]MDP6610423.1 FKBP-type peptidyl-prolyl cis-trans isomerase [Vicinamibacterales bacterium]HAK56024.1 peptidylprolyl isomerase [Acidobacteriota bacterium]|tara:strand:- start:4877 stop:5326 length:450 start_codon:yes stop_codon:yes gene_type:complete